MNDYEKYLAAEILSEGKLVTYRLLSRALKVHVHTAKQMLFEFHRTQNGQKPDSVHATYLLYGEKLENQPSADEDVEMSSSPPGEEPEALSEPTRALTLTLVQEDKLKDALSLYKSVLSVQVYSLGPHPTKDLQLVAEANQGLSEHSNGAISLDTSKGYGGIINSNVRRKDRKGARPAVTSDAPKPQPPPQKPMPAKPSVGSQLKNKASESPSSSQGTSTPSGERSGSGPTKPRSGGIMQSFAKAAASKADPKRKPASQPTQDSAAKTPSTAMMSDDDDGEVDDHSGVLPQPKAPGDSAKVRKARAEREAELKRMMEDDEDEEDEAEEAHSSPDEEPEEPLPDAEATEPKEEGDKPSQEQEDSQPSELVSSSGDGRKRGKRKVIKKRQVQDDEGYFVTIREAAWESFSEDEAPPPKKATPAAAPSSGGASKAKKPAPKGQGNIMSFFGKKS